MLDLGIGYKKTVIGLGLDAKREQRVKTTLKIHQKTSLSNYSKLSLAQRQSTCSNINFTGVSAKDLDNFDVRLSRLIKSGELDNKQKQTLHRGLKLPDNKSFIQLLAPKPYYQLSPTIDKYTLIENSIIKNQENSIKQLMDSETDIKTIDPKLEKFIDIMLIVSKQKDKVSSLNKEEKLEYLRDLPEEKKQEVLNTTMEAWKIKFLPSVMQKTYDSMASKQEQINKTAKEILLCTTPGIKNEWTEKLGIGKPNALTTDRDIKAINKLCQRLTTNSDDANAIFVTFFDDLIAAKKLMRAPRIKNGEIDVKALNSMDVTKIAETSMEKKLEKLPDDWYSDTWYYCYPNYTNTKGNEEGSLDDLTDHLDYLKEIGVKNLYILPHYESPLGDGGYDISNFKAAERLGGEEAMNKLLSKAADLGIGIGSDLVFNHTSNEHEWFKKAQEGNPKYYDFYLKKPKEWLKIDPAKDVENTNKVNDGYGGGDIILHAPDYNKDGYRVTDDMTLIFPDVSKINHLPINVEGLEGQRPIFREFYPFQVDLRLDNPDVIHELFSFVGEELSSGMLGKRTDAIAHWLKEPGTNQKNSDATYALQELLKEFMVHVSPKSIILPEVVTSSEALLSYAGEQTRINNKKTTTQGDYLFDFKMQAMCSQLYLLGTTDGFWNYMNNLTDKIDESNPLEFGTFMRHHDEIYVGTYDSDKQEQIRELTKEHGGQVYKNGLSAGCRTADLLNNDQRRIANSIFVLNMMPATPTYYYGEEIGASNNPKHMEMRQKNQFETLHNLLGDDEDGNPVIPEEKCEDPRELMRGPISKDKFTSALNNHFAGVETVKIMNKLREEYSAMRAKKIKEYETNDKEVFGVIKLPRQNPRENEKNVALLGLSNLSENQKTVDLDWNKLREQLNIPEDEAFKLKFIFREEGSDKDNVSVTNGEEEKLISNAITKLDLKAYSSVLLEPVFI